MMYLLNILANLHTKIIASNKMAEQLFKRVCFANFLIIHNYYSNSEHKSPQLYSTIHKGYKNNTHLFYQIKYFPGKTFIHYNNGKIIRNWFLVLQKANLVILRPLLDHWYRQLILLHLLAS